MKVLQSMYAIRLWSSLYKAAMNHLMQDTNNLQTFLFDDEDEKNVLYLEFVTGESRD